MGHVGHVSLNLPKITLETAQMSQNNDTNNKKNEKFPQEKRIKD